MIDLNEFIVKEAPTTCFYIPNFITEAEEKLLIHDIIKTPVSYENIARIIDNKSIFR